MALGCAFVPLRKPGKLPGATISADYVTEYSTDRIEMHVGAVQPGQRVVLVDDLIATGGTLRECPGPARHACYAAHRDVMRPGLGRSLHAWFWCAACSYACAPSGRALGCCCVWASCGTMGTHSNPVPANLPGWAAGAGVELISSARAHVVEAACVIELPELQGRAKLGDLPLHVLVEKEGL